MAHTPRSFILELGGFQKVADRLEAPYGTVHHWTRASDGKLPSHLYLALCELAVEAGVAPPAPELFRFLALPPAERFAA
jgi:hypothetical protein